MVHRRDRQAWIRYRREGVKPLWIKGEGVCSDGRRHAPKQMRRQDGGALLRLLLAQRAVCRLRCRSSPVRGGRWPQGEVFRECAASVHGRSGCCEERQTGQPEAPDTPDGNLFAHKATLATGRPVPRTPGTQDPELNPESVSVYSHEAPCLRGLKHIQGAHATSSRSSSISNGLARIGTPRCRARSSSSA